MNNSGTSRPPAPKPVPTVTVGKAVWVDMCLRLSVANLRIKALEKALAAMKKETA